MLVKRVITAIIGVIAAIFIVNFGQWVFALAALLLAALAWHEYCNMMKRLEIKVASFLGLLAIALLSFIAWQGNSKEMMAVVLFLSLILLAKTVLAHTKFNLRDAVYTIAGIIYIGLTFSHLSMLRFTDTSLYIGTSFFTLQAGAVYLWFAFIGTWASDTFAFLVGTKIGKHKLAPAISPGKTWEGFTGGAIGSIAAVLACGYLWKISLVHSAVMGLLIGVVAPLGDLVESALKRFAGVKDSGRLLPGHGGVLDRFDSMMFVVPVIYYYVYIFFGH